MPQFERHYEFGHVRPPQPPRCIARMKTTIIVAAAMMISSARTYENHVERRLIVGGEVVSVNTKTYVVSLRDKKDSITICGGSLISPTHVLSASHCMAPGPRWVSIGGHYSNGTQEGEQIKVVSVMIHPEYLGDVLYYDVAVLELERPSKFTPVKLAAPDNSDFQPGKMATVMGWGYESHINGTQSRELMRVDVPLISHAVCKEYMYDWPWFMCAGGVENRDACLADSGGPLVLESANGEDVQIGVAIGSKDGTCGHKGIYGLYTPVSNTRAWIATITGGSGTCLP